MLYLSSCTLSPCSGLSLPCLHSLVLSTGRSYPGFCSWVGRNYPRSQAGAIQAMLYFSCWCWQLCKSSENKISFCSYSLSRKSEAVGGEKNLDRSGTAGTTQQPYFQEKCLSLRSESIQWVLKHIISPLAVLCSSASSYVSKSTHATLILCLPQSVCFSSNLMVSFFSHPCQCKEQVFSFQD